ncbi:hypothetical protein Agub_g2643 [Astrephomene gubernaculifera]|uniref:Protein kinase domain-containing protein n=1 Tax=Astrephomene gubernaculifera TaxID=47775 RepID=A0AAD3DK13_9CHLO|nr:hypothetical protein Agub_g2643 [Astrephomene gubernaculifera]
MPEVDQLLLAALAHDNGSNNPQEAAGGGAGAQHKAPAANGGSTAPANGSKPPAGSNPNQQPQPPQSHPKQQQQPQPKAPQQQQGSQQGDANGNNGNSNNNGRTSPAAALSTSKLKQARRDMLRNAMELAVMRSISHVNIATVYAVYDNVILERLKREGGGTAYALRRQGPQDMQLGSKPVFVALCMELCDSGSLASKLEERSFPRLLPAPPPPSASISPSVMQFGGAGAAGLQGGPVSRSGRVLDMVGIYLTVLEVACALRYLHARRLLHRDIKSANILLKASPTDPRGWTCKLADFGSAIVLDQFQPPEDMEEEEGAGGHAGPEAGVAGGPGAGGGGGGGPGGRWFAVQEQSWGTITHMSPESMDNNSRVDASSDIFALGIVMWEIASGRGYRPYKELAPEQIGAAVRGGLRPAFTSDVPQAYRSLAQQCWAAEPHRRPSAVELVAAVKAQLSLLQAESRQQQHLQQAMQQQQQRGAAAAPAGPAAGGGGRSPGGFRG